MEDWTHPRAVALPDEIDLSDIDDVKVIKYRDIFIGFIVLMDNTQSSLTRHTQLMWSRDGLSWERLPNRPRFISFRSMVLSGDRIIFYYGYGSHGRTNLSFLAKDRFIGQQAGPDGGYLLTRQFILEGDRLEINCRSQKKLKQAGSECLPGLDSLIKAELLKSPVEHHAASPYPGYGMDECDNIFVQDEMRQVVTWNGSADLSALRGQSVYIRFYLRNTTLFSFCMAQ